MAGYFDEGYYLKSKLAQLQKAGEKDADGNDYDATTLLQAIHDAGMTPESHYEIHGRTEKLNPNAYFNEVEYLEAKLAQVNSVGETDPDGKPYILDTLIKAIEAAGMTAIEHYEKFGGKEMDAKGNLINPSNAFDANAYATAKLAELMKVEPEKWAGKTAADVVEAIAEAGMTPVSHYDQYGAAEAAAAKIALVQTVPVAARVANDPARATVTGENVPSNYNAPTPPPATVAAENATPVTKPADVGAKVPADVSPAVTVPSKPVLTEKDAGYKAPPANLVDTNEKPVVPPTTENGSVTDNWITVNPDGSGTITTPEGKPGGTLPENTITPDGDGGIVIPPDVKPTPPVDPTPDPTPDPVDPTPPTPAPVFSADITNGTLTLTGTATGAVKIGVDASGHVTGSHAGAGLTFANDAVVTTVVASGLKGQGLTLRADSSVNATGSAQDDMVQFKLGTNNANTYDLGAGNDALIVDLGMGDTVSGGVYKGGAGTDTLKINLDASSIATGTNYKVESYTTEGNTTDGVKIVFENAAFNPDSSLLAKADSFEVLRFNAAGYTPHTEAHKSNATILVTADAVANKQLEFTENARVYNITTDQIVRDSWDTGSLQMTLVAKSANTVTLDTVAKQNDAYVTTITGVVAVPGDKGASGSGFTNLNLTGEGNVVLDNSASGANSAVNITSTMTTGSFTFKSGAANDKLTLGAEKDTVLFNFDATTDVINAETNGKDTITDFNLAHDKLGVKDFLQPSGTTGEWKATMGTMTKDAATTIADNNIYNVKLTVASTEVSTAAALYTKLFTDTTNGFTAGADGTEALFMVTCSDGKTIVAFYDAVCTSTTASNADLFIAAELTGVPTTGAFTIDNFC